MAGPHATSDARNYVGIGREAVKGTGVAPTSFPAFTDDVDLSHNQEISGLKEAGGNGSITLSEKLGHMPAGGFAFRARPSITGKLAAYMLGADAVTGAGPYDHALTHDLVTDYLTIEQNLADEATERFIDCVISQLTFEVENTSTHMVKVSGSWVGGTPTVQGAPTAESYDAETPFVLSNGVFTLNGVVAANVQRWTTTLTMRYAVEKIAGVVPLYLIKLGLDVTGEVEQLMLLWSDEYRLVQYGSAAGVAHTSAPVAGAMIADFNYGAGAAARGLKINVPNLDWLDAKYTSLNPEGSAVKVVRPFHGRVSGATPIVTVTAKTNDSASYLV
jgi:hypothetical protein